MGRSAVAVLGVRVVAALAGLLLVLPAPAARAELVGSVSGVVTSAGEPVEYAWVSVIPVSPTGRWAGQGVVVPTDAQGRYRVADVYTDFVKVQVRGPVGLATTYWPAAHTFADARALRVTSSGARADVDLPRGGSASGRVVDARTGQPVPGALVTAQAASGTSWEQVGTPGLGAATEPGAFALVDLPPVPVVLWVQAPPGSRYLGQWYDDAGYIGEARWIDGSATTTGIRVRLRQGAELAGTVRDDTGAPVAGAAVSVIGCPGLCPQLAQTDADGRYRFPALAPGPGLLVRAEAEAAGYLSQWFREPDRTEEALITLAPGQRRADVDLVLARGAFLVVRVLAEGTDTALTGVSAQLESRSNPILGFLSSTRDRLEVRGAAAAHPGPATPGEGLLGVLPTVAADAAVAGEPDPDEPGGSTPAQPGTLQIGPVPAGEYRLELYPGEQDATFLPVRWTRSTAIARDGTVTLAAGQRVEATVWLAPGTRSPGPAQPGTVPAPSAAQRAAVWPGLPAGFLDPGPDWAS